MLNLELLNNQNTSVVLHAAKKLAEEGHFIREAALKDMVVPSSTGERKEAKKKKSDVSSVAETIDGYIARAIDVMTEEQQYKRRRLELEEKQLWLRTHDQPQLQPQPQGLCCICRARAANMVFMDCKHLVVCNDCVGVLQKCPVCRTSVHQAPMQVSTS